MIDNLMIVINYLALENKILEYYASNYAIISVHEYCCVLFFKSY